jgi:hypothetical protein
MGVEGGYRARNERLLSVHLRRDPIKGIRTLSLSMWWDEKEIEMPLAKVVFDHNLQYMILSKSLLNFDVEADAEIAW